MKKPSYSQITDAILYSGISSAFGLMLAGLAAKDQALILCGILLILITTALAVSFPSADTRKREQERKQWMKEQANNPQRLTRI